MNDDPQHNRLRALADLIVLKASHAYAHIHLTNWAPVYERENRFDFKLKWQQRVAKTFEMMGALHKRFPTLKQDYADWRTKRVRERLKDQMASYGIEIVLVDWWEDEDAREPRTERVDDIIRECLNVMKEKVEKTQE